MINKKIVNKGTAARGPSIFLKGNTMEKIVLTPEQLPDIETAAGVKYLRYQNNDTGAALFCRFRKEDQTLFIHYAEEIFYDDAAEDWSSRPIQPAEALANFGHGEAFHPIRGKMLPFSYRILLPGEQTPTGEAPAAQ